MPIENFLRFEGKCYDVGTKLKFYARIHQINVGIEIGVIKRFDNGTVYIESDDGFIYYYSTMLCNNMFDCIIEILEPVYYVPKEDTMSDHRTRPAPWDVEIGWIWYIIIMVVGTIFNDRLLIWIVATAIFFLWKSGRLGGQK